MLIKLSDYAKIFYYEYKLYPDNSGYNIIFDQNISGELNVEQLSLALTYMVKNMFILNCHVLENSDDIFWKQHDAIHPLNIMSDIVDNAEISTFVKKPFNLNEDFLYRFYLFGSKDAGYRLILVFHHIVVGGKHMEDIIDYISNFYNQSIANNMFLDKSTQIENYTNISQNYVLETDPNESKHFFEKNIADYEISNFEFLKLKNESEHSVSSFKEIRFEFTDEDKLKAVKQQYAISAFKLGQIAYAILLSRYCSTSKVLLNFPVQLVDFNQIYYGANINTCVIGFEILQDTSIRDLLLQSKEFYCELKKYHKYPIYHQMNGVDKNILKYAFIQTPLKDKKFSFGDLQGKVNHDFNIDMLNDFVFEQDVGASTIKYRVRYNHNVLNQDLVDAFIANYNHLFDEVIECLLSGNDNKCVVDLSVINKNQYQTVVYDWNTTDRDYQKNNTIQEIFEEQVAKTPDDIALVTDDAKLSYRELNQRSNQLAYKLRAEYLRHNGKELQADELILIYMDRSIEMIIAVLAVIKAGGAYVPLDLEYPEERINYILQDTQSKLLVTQSKCFTRLNEMMNVGSINMVDVGDYQSYQNESIEPLNINNGPNSLAYVIYTSGTTGLPKGVMIEHQSIINLTNSVEVPKNSRVLQYASLVFDVSVWEIFNSLLRGLSLYLIDKQHQIDSTLLYRYIKEHRINVASIPPIVLANLESDKLDCLNYLITGGDVCPDKVRYKWLSDSRIFINAYGPTECSVSVTLHKYNVNSSIYNIGKAFSNTKLYVLDKNYNPSPIGAIGELYIAGAGLARGYLNSAELTADKFIPNRFATELDIQNGYTRMYKTGDLVRWLPDGDLEYVGRNDFQVKIRGFRIELGEIEKQLSMITGIKNSCVVVRTVTKTAEKYIAAYYVLNKNSEYIIDNGLSRDEILNQLSLVLPDYMLPSALMELDSLPCTINGKLNSAALPEPKFVVSDNYVAPTSELEKILCNIWSHILGNEKIGIQDNFFRSGGNSILAIKLVHSMNKNLGVQINVADIFIHRTIFEIISHLLPTFTLEEEGEI